MAKTRFYISMGYEGKGKPKVEEHAMRPPANEKRKFIGPFLNREDAETYAKDPTQNARLIGTLEKARYYVAITYGGKGEPEIQKHAIQPRANEEQSWHGPFKTREGAAFYAENYRNPAAWLKGKPDVTEANRRAEGTLVVPESAPVPEAETVVAVKSTQASEAETVVAVKSTQAPPAPSPDVEDVVGAEAAPEVDDAEEPEA